MPTTHNTATSDSRQARMDARLDSLDEAMEALLINTQHLVQVSGIQGTGIAQLWDEFQLHRRDGHGGRS